MAAAQGLKAHQVAAAGIGRTFQNIRLFVNLSALENVMIGRHARTRAGVIGAVLRTRRTLAEEKQIERRGLELLDYVGIRARANDAAGSLAYGDQRRLEIARALATEPKLLALDEPAAGMNPAERVALGKLIRRIRDDGVTVLLIEHDVRLVMNVCDRVMVLDYGEKIAEGRRRKSRKTRRSSKRTWARRVLLEVKALEVHYGGIRAVKGIDLEVGQGELVCLIGANGAGKTTTLKAICRLLPSSGKIAYAGSDITRESARAAAPGSRHGARRARHLSAAHGGRESRHGRVRAAAPMPSASTPLSRVSRSGARRSPAHCPVASSRCSRSRAR